MKVPPGSITISVVEQDALRSRVDVLVLKYAQGFHGFDAHVAQALRDQKARVPKPHTGTAELIGSLGVAQAPQMLFVGVTHLRDFRYPQIRVFGSTLLAALAEKAPDTRSICVTVPGAGHGLDELYAFEHLLEGLQQGIAAGAFPRELAEIRVTEIDAARAELLAGVMAQALPGGFLVSPYTPIAPRPAAGRTPPAPPAPQPEAPPAPRPETRPGPRPEPERPAPLPEPEQPAVPAPEPDSEAVCMAFVAIPYGLAEFNAFYRWVIHPMVRKAGFVCERADQSLFAGDVMEHVLARIGMADVVIGVLTGGNANVALEVGVAWALGKPTLLLASSEADLGFDTRGRKCLFYGDDFLHIARRLERELSAMRKKLACG